MNKVELWPEMLIIGAYLFLELKKACIQSMVNARIQTENIMPGICVLSVKNAKQFFPSHQLKKHENTEEMKRK